MVVQVVAGAVANASGVLRPRFIWAAGWAGVGRTPPRNVYRVKDLIEYQIRHADAVGRRTIKNRSSRGLGKWFEVA
ncbi:hypothetical protein EVAR_64437_1 [Eumeta japonica]|uniref:Uncharacterized protein n=1 Tax=Eumeta variegata TaxID=151549 RepID=A0A4C1YU78_EUMVA|nr:hypothetical protein EVAR_64437_1 [Eumeta japonica]